MNGPLLHTAAKLQVGETEAWFRAMSFDSYYHVLWESTYKTHLLCGIKRRERILVNPNGIF